MPEMYGNRPFISSEVAELALDTEAEKRDLYKKIEELAEEGGIAAVQEYVYNLVVGKVGEQHAQELAVYKEQEIDAQREEALKSLNELRSSDPQGRDTWSGERQ